MAMFDKRPGVLRGLAAAALLLQCAACGPSVNYLYMSKGGDQKSTSFNEVGDEIHCVMEVVGGDEDTVLTFNLSGSGALELTDSEIYPRPDPQQTNPVQVDVQLFQYDPDTGARALQGPWPTGSYTMDVHLDDELEDSLDFEITN